MSVAAGRGKLIDAMDVLEARWHVTCPVWSDVVRREFEKNYWELLGPQVRSTVEAMDHMTHTLIQLRHECE